MKTSSRLRLTASLLFVLVLSMAVAPLWVFAQTASGEAEILPKKAEAPAEQGPTGKSDTSPSSSAPSSSSSTSKADSMDDLSPFSLSVIVLSMLLGGLLLLFVECALIPGFGLVGLTGIIVILSGLGIAFWKLDLHLAVIYTVISIVALIGVVFWAIYVFPHTATGKRFVLETRISVDDGYTTTIDLQKYIGMEGVASSDLRPSGIARIGEERMDVVSDGDFIPRGTKIKVLLAKQTTLVVIPIPGTDQPPAAS